MLVHKTDVFCITEQSESEFIKKTSKITLSKEFIKNCDSAASILKRNNSRFRKKNECR